MYKIKIRNDVTGSIIWEYGFSRYIMERIHFYFNETDNNYYHMYDILEILPICFTFKTFKKCLTHHREIIYN